MFSLGLLVSSRPALDRAHGDRIGSPLGRRMMKVITQDSIATIGFGQILWSGRGEQGADALKLPTIFFLQIIISRDNPPLLDQLMDLDGWECNNLLRGKGQQIRERNAGMRGDQ